MRAILTTGWDEAVDGAVRAASLYHEIEADGTIEPARLKAALGAVPQPPVIAGLDALFRRRPTGFGPVKRVLGALAELGDSLGSITCRINAITYAFLVGAKNLDLILPEATDEDGRATGPFRDALPAWQGQILTLEAYERDGEVPTDDRLRATYLGLRPVMARRAARDEQRSLAFLLTSGPSSPAEITADLGLGYDLTQRALAPFRALGVVEARDDGRFVIAAGALPLVLFVLRETMGIDPLAALTG